MMRPRACVPVLPIMVAAMIFASALWASQDGPTDGLMLLGADMPDLRRPAVPFDHDTHADQFDCLDCHHLIVNGENILDPADLYTGDAPASCVDCHHASPNARMRAYHGQCAGCHEQYDDAPKSCNGCHGS